MVAQVTFTTDFTIEGIAELKERLALFDSAAVTAADVSSLAEQNVAATPLATAAPRAEAFDTAIEEVRRRTGSNSQALLRQMFSYESAFTMPDVARDMQLEEGTVQARFRNLCKPLNRVQSGDPSLPNFWEATHYDGRWHFTANQEWREAVERLWA